MSGILRTHSKDFTRFLKIADPIILIFIYIKLIGLLSLDIIFPYSLLLISYIIIGTCLNNSKLYISYRRKSLSVLFRRILYAWSSSLLFSIFLFSYTNLPHDKNLMINWFFGGFLYLICAHVFTRKALKLMRNNGRNLKNIIFWGKPSSAINFFNQISNNQHLGYKFFGWLSDSDQKYKLPKNMPDKLGNKLDDLKKINRDQVDQLILGSFDSNLYSMEDLLYYFGDFGIPLGYAPSWASIGMSLTPDFIGTQPYLDIWVCYMSFFDRLIKRFSDILLALIFIFIASPIMLIASVLIYFDSKDGIIFKQKRAGLNGKTFYIYKFRTMKKIINADKEFLKQAIKNDPRTTNIGKHLRAWSIDELPQLFNVLMGDMSIVGPRPHAVEHNEKYRNIIPGYMQRHLVKPGITGLAQVRGLRGETSNDNLMRLRVESDLNYQLNWSLLLDLKIICKTILKLKSANSY